MSAPNDSDTLDDSELSEIDYTNPEWVAKITDRPIEEVRKDLPAE